MKLLRAGTPVREVPAIPDGGGATRSLEGVVDDIAGDVLSDAGLDALRGLDLSALPAIDAATRIGPCVGNVGKFIRVGLNYSDHAAETGMGQKAQVYSRKGQVMRLGIEGLGEQRQTLGQA